MKRLRWWRVQAGICQNSSRYGGETKQAGLSIQCQETFERPHNGNQMGEQNLNYNHASPLDRQHKRLYIPLTIVWQNNIRSYTASGNFSNVQNRPATKRPILCTVPNNFLLQYNCFCFLWRCAPIRAMASSFLRFLDHTQQRITVGRTPLDEWSARRRDLYLTTHNTHNRQTSIPLVELEPTISVGERPQTYALDRAATGIGYHQKYKLKIWRLSNPARVTRTLKL